MLHVLLLKVLILLMNNLLILGAGGHGKVLAETALATQLWNTIYFLDDSCGFISDFLIAQFFPSRPTCFVTRHFNNAIMQ